MQFAVNALTGRHRIPGKPRNPGKLPIPPGPGNPPDGRPWLRMKPRKSPRHWGQGGESPTALKICPRGHFHEGPLPCGDRGCGSREQVRNSHTERVPIPPSVMPRSDPRTGRSSWTFRLPLRACSSGMQFGDLAPPVSRVSAHRGLGPCRLLVTRQAGARPSPLVHAGRPASACAGTPSPDGPGVAGHVAPRSRHHHQSGRSRASSVCTLWRPDGDPGLQPVPRRGRLRS